jgi:1-pyrroline-5-carboxylate dehydrogenase
MFLKARMTFLATYASHINATSMLGKARCLPGRDRQCMGAYRFPAFQCTFLSEIYKQQPISGPGMHNRVEWRPLEGFVLAVTPFNFTAISGNLPSSAAMCGNVVVWKPANTQVYSAQMIMRVLKKQVCPMV